MARSVSFDRYTRLARNWGGWSSLWKGDDHLVSARGRGFLLPYAEVYHRFLFREIQGFTLVKRSRVWLALLYGAGLLGFGGFLVLVLSAGGEVSWGRAVAVSALSLGVLAFAALLVRHLILGPPCRCEIVTAISQERLFPLSRYHAAKEVLAGLEGEIRAQQPAFGPAVAGEGGFRAVANREAGRSPFTIALPLPWTFSIAAVFGLLALAALHLGGVGLPGAVFLLLFGLSFLLVTSLISAVRRATPESLRHCLWGILGLFFVFIGLVVVYLPMAIVEEQSFSIGPTGPLKAFAAIGGGGVFYVLFLAVSLAISATGLTGLALVSSWRKRIEASRRTFSPGGGEDAAPAEAPRAPGKD